MPGSQSRDDPPLPVAGAADTWSVAGLAVRRHGRAADAPTLALFHGNGDSGGCWPDAVRRWRSGYHVVGVDLRGHGSSPRFASEQLGNPGDVFVEDTVDVLGELCRPGVPLVAVGHSLGAAALAAAAAEHRLLVDALVLIDPPWDSPPILGPRPDVGAERVRLITAYTTDPEAELLALREREPAWPEEERVAWIEAKAELDLDYIATGAGRPSTPWVEHVPSLAVPTLVVTGDADVIVGIETRATLQSMANPAIEVEVLAGLGHYVRQGATDRFHAAVDPWIARLTRARSR
jgi:pimeloyl-ACP methyl ester carboxylesterase